MQSLSVYVAVLSRDKSNTIEHTIIKWYTLHVMVLRVDFGSKKCERPK